VHWEQGNVAGKASQVLEIPVNWYLDDFPPLAYVTGIQAGMQDSETILKRWKGKAFGSPPALRSATRGLTTTRTGGLSVSCYAPERVS
jgi:hypothetical protein